jgi:hypothetical protein
MTRFPDIPGMSIIDMRPELDAIRRQYAPRYWHAAEALQAAASLWGITPSMAEDVIRPSGTFRHAQEETLACIGQCYAAVSLVHAPNGLWAMATHGQTSTQGYGAAPSVWSDNAYHSRDDARLVAVHILASWFQGIITGRHTDSDAERDLGRRIVSLLEAEKTPQLSLF